MKFQRELTKDAWQEALKLMAANNAETGFLPDRQFAPKLTHYCGMDEAGISRVYTMRDEAGELVGYSIFMIMNHYHFPDIKTAFHDVTYVDPKHRGLSAVRFLLWCDQQLQSEGVEVIFRQVSEKKNYGRTLSRMGYAPIETVYMRRL